VNNTKINVVRNEQQLKYHWTTATAYSLAETNSVDKL